MASDVTICRGCRAPLTRVLVDLGMAPLANAFVDDLDARETFYPLRPLVCELCFLVQLPNIELPEHIFNDEYAYFSSMNAGFVKHARDFVEKSIKKLNLNEKSLVIEVASNDGYLLQHFLPHRIPVLGVEPSSNTAAVAQSRGIQTLVRFFGAGMARSLGRADLIVANNVLAHVPDLHDFVEGLKLCLAHTGRISIEFPHLLNLLEQTQFDTIYHEHYSYFSVVSLQPVFAAHKLEIIAVETLSTHGGSLRVWLSHEGMAEREKSVEQIIDREIVAGLKHIDCYDLFRKDVLNCRDNALSFLISSREMHKTIVGYGAPAKGNTFLNFLGVKPDLLPWTVDAMESKQGRYLPGTRIPVYPEQRIVDEQPYGVLILPWNWVHDITEKVVNAGYKGKLFTAVPVMRQIR